MNESKSRKQRSQDRLLRIAAKNAENANKPVNDQLTPVIKSSTTVLDRLTTIQPKNIIPIHVEKIANLSNPIHRSGRIPEQEKSYTCAKQLNPIQETRTSVIRPMGGSSPLVNRPGGKNECSLIITTQSGVRTVVEADCEKMPQLIPILNASNSSIVSKKKETVHTSNTSLAKCIKSAMKGGTSGESSSYDSSHSQSKRARPIFDIINIPMARLRNTQATIMGEEDESPLRRSTGKAIKSLNVDDNNNASLGNVDKRKSPQQLNMTHSKTVGKLSDAMKEICIGSSENLVRKDSFPTPDMFRCLCERDKTNILCQMCGFNLFGRVRKQCPLHCRVSYLLDIEICPRCHFEQLVEIVDSNCEK